MADTYPTRNRFGKGLLPVQVRVLPLAFVRTALMIIRRKLKDEADEQLAWSPNQFKRCEILVVGSTADFGMPIKLDTARMHREMNIIRQRLKSIDIPQQSGIN